MWGNNCRRQAADMEKLIFGSASIEIDSLCESVRLKKREVQPCTSR